MVTNAVFDSFRGEKLLSNLLNTGYRAAAAVTDASLLILSPYRLVLISGRRCTYYTSTRLRDNPAESDRDPMLSVPEPHLTCPENRYLGPSVATRVRMYDGQNQAKRRAMGRTSVSTALDGFKSYGFSTCLIFLIGKPGATASSAPAVTAALLTGIRCAHAGTAERLPSSAGSFHHEWYPCTHNPTRTNDSLGVSASARARSLAASNRSGKM